MKKVKNFISKYIIEIILIICSLIFSSWLMFSTFSYDNGSMMIATKAWSDFASHIPLIRSFSFGNNFPVEYPLFSGEPIRYHYLFYLLVGLLEKMGLRIDWALNLPSAISFFSLIIIIYYLAKNLFKSTAIGILSVLFFLFNGSFSFLEFFKTHPPSLNTINDVLANSSFPSFGPYDGKIISAFWNLNIYTNQRHLALPLAFLFLLVFLIIKAEEKKRGLPLFLIVISGLLIGLLPFSHSSIFIMIFAVLGILFLLLPKQRKSIFLMLFIGGLISIPRVLFLKETATYVPHIQLGYLISNSLTLRTFVDYWAMNFGLSLILIPIGLIFSSSLQRKIFFAFLSLFLIGNLFQFSPEIAGNHKFFNAFLVIGNMFTAFAIIKLWNLKKFTKIIVPLLVFFLILSGVIDFFPVKNDRFITLADYPINPDVKWIMDNTPKNAVFLNSSYLYNPASLAGRKIFLGWPYFAWSLGYNTQERDDTRKSLLNTNNIRTFCENALKYNIDYVEINTSEKYDFPINYTFFEVNLPKKYESTHYKIYDTKNTCKK